MKIQKNKENQNQAIRGITLIALVVKIIVPIILAGVSINRLIGENGIITQAQNAKKGNKNKRRQRKNKISYFRNANRRKWIPKIKLS